MPKLSSANTFIDLQNKGIISKEDPNSIFRDLSQIGAGNFGVVFSATVVATGEMVAVKKLKFDAKRKVSMDDLKDMIREIKFITRIKHKNCVESRGCYLDQQVPWLVMEYCLGSVADILKVQKHPLKECEISCIVSEVLTGLVYIHSKKCIHRDIKAANILFTEGGGVKIGDFGSVSSKSPANSFVGTPYWIAPEVILAMESGLYETRADVWSLGITCIEMAELKPPYMESANTMAALYQIALNPAPTLKESNWTEDFHNFVDYVLKKDVDERPTSDEALNHRFCSSVKNPIPVLLDLVQRGMAQADEVDQVRPKFKKRIDESEDQLTPEQPRLNCPSANGKPVRELSYDKNSSSTGTESASNSIRSEFTGSSSSLHAAEGNSAIGAGRVVFEGSSCRSGQTKDSAEVHGHPGWLHKQKSEEVGASKLSPSSAGRRVRGEQDPDAGAAAGRGRHKNRRRNASRESRRSTRNAMGTQNSIQSMSGISYANLSDSLYNRIGDGASAQQPSHPAESIFCSGYELLDASRIQPPSEAISSSTPASTNQNPAFWSDNKPIPTESTFPEPPPNLTDDTHPWGITPTSSVDGGPKPLISQPNSRAIPSPHHLNPSPTSVVAAGSTQSRGLHGKTSGFPTLKTQRMMRAPAPKSAVGADGHHGVTGVKCAGSQSPAACQRHNQSDDSLFFDDFYSFGAIKRLCARHLKKLEQMTNKLKEIENAKMHELSREYNQFINTRKKSVCRLQEQHEHDLDRELKKGSEEEVKLWRQLEADLKERLKQARKTRIRPKSMVGASGGGDEFLGGDGSPSAYNDIHATQSEVCLLHKKLQSANNIKFQQWKYEMLRHHRDIQLKQFEERKTLQNQILDQKASMLLDHHAQLEGIELANMRVKHHLQSKHLEEKCAFFDNEQKHFDCLQQEVFEKEERTRRKLLAKELKHFEESLRPQSKVASWFRKKNFSAAPIDKSKTTNLSCDPNLTINDVRRHRTEALELMLKQDRAKMAEKMSQLREQKRNYQERLTREFLHQRGQEDEELRKRIALRADKLEEAIEKNKQTVGEEHNQEKRNLGIYFASKCRALESQCQFMGVDFQAIMLEAQIDAHQSANIVSGHPNHQDHSRYRSSYLPP